MADDQYRIEDVEKKTGLTKRMLRYYEELGILSPDRSEGNYRIYTSGDIETLARLRDIKDHLGFQMGDLKAFAGIRKRIGEILTAETPDPSAVALCRAEVERLLSLLEEKQRIIGRTREQLNDGLSRIEKLQTVINHPGGLEPMKCPDKG